MHLPAEPSPFLPGPRPLPPARCHLCPPPNKQGMSDLMRENEDGVSVMQWLRSAYPSDWDNLLERLKPKLGGLDPR